MQDVNLNDFCSSYNFKNMIKEPTCYKNPLNPSCIDLIITNRPNSFQDTNVIETGLSDFHKLTISVMKMFLRNTALRLLAIGIIKNLPLQFFVVSCKRRLLTLIYVV